MLKLDGLAAFAAVAEDPADRGPSAKIRALADHLRKAFGDPPHWESGVKLPRKATALKSSPPR